MDIYITGAIIYCVSLLSDVIYEQNRIGIIKSRKEGLFIISMVVAASLLWPVTILYTFYVLVKGGQNGH